MNNEESIQDFIGYYGPNHVSDLKMHTHWRKTIQRPVVLSGMGIHTGKMFTLELHPWNDGIVMTNAFNGDRRFKVTPLAVTSSFLATTLNSEIQTVEHLFAALSGLGITDILISVFDSYNREDIVSVKEIPAFDGSAMEFRNAILDVGIHDLGMPIESISVNRGHTDVTIQGDRENSWSTLDCMGGYDTPLTIVCELDLPFGTQKRGYIHSSDSFVHEISRAKTFVMQKDAQKILAQGYGQGADQQNTIIFEDTGKVVNSSALTYLDEPVRHKILDLLGDLYLIGVPLHGRIFAKNPNHALNLKVASYIYTQMKHNDV